jgi:hypothetical protein
VAKRNPRTGSRFDDFLKDEGIFEEVQAKALKRALAEQLQESMQAAKLTKLDMTGGTGESYDRVIEACAHGVVPVVENDYAFPELIVHGERVVLRRILTSSFTTSQRSSGCISKSRGMRARIWND